MGAMMDYVVGRLNTTLRDYVAKTGNQTPGSPTIIRLIRDILQELERDNIYSDLEYEVIREGFATQEDLRSGRVKMQDVVWQKYQVKFGPSAGVARGKPIFREPTQPTLADVPRLIESIPAQVKDEEDAIKDYGSWAEADVPLSIRRVYKMIQEDEMRHRDELNELLNVLKTTRKV